MFKEGLMMWSLCVFEWIRGTLSWGPLRDTVTPSCPHDSGVTSSWLLGQNHMGANAPTSTESERKVDPAASGNTLS